MKKGLRGLSAVLNEWRSEGEERERRGVKKEGVKDDKNETRVVK